MKRLAAAFVLACAACGGVSGPAAVVNGKTLQLEIADSQDERAQGLMNRTVLGPDAGMLFAFPEPTVGGFWMKNTLIPLSIAFLDGTKIVGIREMIPCRADPCPSYDPGAAYDRAIEANARWFAKAKAKVGTTVVLRDVHVQPT